MTESKPDASDKEAQRAFETYLENEHDLSIVRNPAFFGLEAKRDVLHEFGHGLYPEASPAADALGGYDDRLTELKSDLGMWVTAGEVLREDDEKDFGTDAVRAIQMSMILDAIRTCRGVGRADPAYELAAKEILERLHGDSVLVERGGKLVIDTSRLGEDLGQIFAGKLKEVLAIYRLAAQGTPESVRASRTKARVIAQAKPEKFLKEVRERT